jgi:ribosome-associated protein
VSRLRLISPLDSESLLKAVVAKLSERKAENISIINMAGKSEIADYMIIASGTSQRHVVALSQHVDEVFNQFGRKVMSVTGKEEGSWVLVDSPEIIVHLFQPEVRENYQLEKLWEDAPVKPASPKQSRTLEIA